MDIKLQKTGLINWVLLLVFIFQIILGFSFYYFTIALSEWSLVWTFLTMVNFTLFALFFVKILNK